MPCSSTMTTSTISTSTPTTPSRSNTPNFLVKHPKYYIDGGDLHIVVCYIQCLKKKNDWQMVSFRRAKCSFVFIATFSPESQQRSTIGFILRHPTLLEKGRVTRIPSYCQMLSQLKISRRFYGYFTTRTFATSILCSESKRQVSDTGDILSMITWQSNNGQRSFVSPRNGTLSKSKNLLCASWISSVCLTC